MVIFVALSFRQCTFQKTFIFLSENEELEKIRVVSDIFLTQF